MDPSVFFRMATKKPAASVILAFSLGLAACGDKPPPAAPPPAEVQVVEVRPSSIPLTRELVGRLSATRSADVRARVAGILVERKYVEGSDVRQGQVLFQIDPAPLQAAYTSAEAALAQAQANATNARALADRTRELATKGWAAKADLDTTEANERSTAAQVKQAQANLQTARINLSYATVRSPIAGRAGEQQVTEGALVGENEATLLTTVEQTDPLYVNFDQSANEVLQLRTAQKAGDVKLAEAGSAQVQIVLPDGTVYDRTGALNFSSVSVDPRTSALALRAQIPNPDRLLLPGMFVTVRLTLGERQNAFLVPQAALQRDNTGPFVLVAAGDKAVEKRVQTSGIDAGNWIVTQGLAAGDAIIVTGLQKIRAGAPVKATPFTAATPQ